MSKKKILYLLLGIILLFTLSTVIYVATFAQPKINFSAQIETVNNEDYCRILGNKQVSYPNKNIENFKHITVQIKVTNPIGINDYIEIQRDVLEQYLANNKKHNSTFYLKDYLK